MNILYSLAAKFWSYIVVTGGAITAALIFISNVKKGEREKIENEANIAAHEYKEDAYNERIERDEEISNLTDDELDDRLSKYVRPRID